MHIFLRLSKIPSNSFFEKHQSANFLRNPCAKTNPLLSTYGQKSPLSPRRGLSSAFLSFSSLYSLRQIIRESQVKIFQNHGHLIVALSKRIIIFPHSWKKSSFRFAPLLFSLFSAPLDRARFFFQREKRERRRRKAGRFSKERNKSDRSSLRTISRDKFSFSDILGYSQSNVNKRNNSNCVTTI